MAWTHTFDFTADTDGWRPQRPPHWAGTSGTWDRINGRWVNGCSYGHAATILDRTVTVPQGNKITRIEWWGGIAGGGLTYIGIYINYGWYSVSPIYEGSIIKGDIDVSALNLVGPQTLTVSVELDAGGCGAFSYIDKVVISGDGINPFLYIFDAIFEAYAYRAPITGNPREPNQQLGYSAATYNYVADERFVDHIGQWWVRVISIEEKSNPGVNVNQFVTDAITAGKGGLWIQITPPTTEPGLSAFNSLPQSVAYAIPSVTTVPWNAFTGTFAAWPIDVETLCLRPVNPKPILGAGLPPPPDVIYPRNSHPGVDLFVPDDMNNFAVKSVDTGIVVGIGVSRIDEFGEFADISGGTHFYWGSATQRVNQVRTPGYSVIVRHGHLYVLYGHLASVDKNIWVGARVGAGTTLGIPGLFNERHLHVEVHSYGYPTILDGIGESETSLIGQHGILPVAQQAALMVAPYVYDIMQMLPTPSGYSPADNNNLTFPNYWRMEIQNLPMELFG